MMKKLLLLLTIFAFVLSTSAQDSKGDDFWLMFPENNSSSTQPTLYLTSDVNTSGTVSIPGIPWSQNFNIVAGTITTVNCPSGTSMSSVDLVTNQGIHVVANDEITVYGFSIQQYTTDALLAFPTDAIGKEYTIMGYKNVNFSWNGTNIGVVAAESGTTTLTITPAATVGARTAGVPYNIVLTQGQTYMLRNMSGTSDLTGTHISADKNVAVFGGNRCANVPSSGTLYCDYLIEQIPPNSSWGQEFATVPLATRLNGDTYRFLAQQNATVVKVNGVTVATLNTGEYFEDQYSGYNRVTANKPILVGQFSNGGTWDNVANADPFFLLVPPTDQYLTDYVVNTGTANIGVNFINIISLTSQVSSVMVDGLPIAPGSWTPIPGTNLSGAQISTTVGQHSVSSAFPIGVFIYGFGIDDSYGYLGGQSFSPVATVDSLKLDLVQVATYQAQEKCLQAKVLDQNNDPVVGVKVDFDIFGGNTTNGFGFTDASGVIVFCYNVCEAGTDTIVASIAALTDTATVVVLPTTLSTIPTNANVNQGAQHCVTATVKDGSNIAVPAAVVSFTVIGANSANGTVNTDAAGNSIFCYTATNAGKDTIIVSAGCLDGNVDTVYAMVSAGGNQCNFSTTITPYGVAAAYANAGANDASAYYWGLSFFKSFHVAVSGGVAPYSYLWSSTDGTVKSKTKSKGRLGYPTQSCWMIVEITDANGDVCKDSVWVPFIDITCNQPFLWYYELCNNVTNTTVCVAGTRNMRDSINTGNYTFGPCAVPKAGENFNAASFQVYPNPTDKYVTLSYANTQAQESTLQIVDVNGRVVLQKKVQMGEGQFNQKIDVSGLISGIYYIQLQTNSEIKVEKIQIMH